MASTITTYIIAPNNDDIENIEVLNNIVVVKHRKPDRLNQAVHAAFREMGFYLQRMDAARFYAANLANFDILQMLEAINEVKWKFPYALRIMFRANDNVAWQVVEFNGSEFVYEPF